MPPTGAVCSSFCDPSGQLLTDGENEEMHKAWPTIDELSEPPNVLMANIDSIIGELDEAYLISTFGPEIAHLIKASGSGAGPLITDASGSDVEQRVYGEDSQSFYGSEDIRFPQDSKETLDPLPIVDDDSMVLTSDVIAKASKEVDQQIMDVTSPDEEIDGTLPKGLIKDARMTPLEPLPLEPLPLELRLNEAAYNFEDLDDFLHKDEESTVEQQESTVEQQESTVEQQELTVEQQESTEEQRFSKEELSYLISEEHNYCEVDQKVPVCQRTRSKVNSGSSSVNAEPNNAPLQFVNNEECQRVGEMQVPEFESNSPVSEQVQSNKRAPTKKPAKRGRKARKSTPDKGKPAAAKRVATKSKAGSSKQSKTESQRILHNINEKKRRDEMTQMMNLVKGLVPLKYFAVEGRGKAKKPSKQKILSAADDFVSDCIEKHKLVEESFSELLSNTNSSEVSLQKYVKVLFHKLENKRKKSKKARRSSMPSPI